ncbi:MAG: hypothetical protein AAFV53_22320 [Myxococcota bacterium]
MRRFLSPFLLAAAVVWSSAALAKDAVIPPLITRGMDAKQTNNITTLIASELDFFGAYDQVKQLERRPSSFSARCLTSASCLEGLTRSNGADAAVVGAATANGARLDVMLVLFENGQIVRSQEFTVQNTPSAIADEASNFVRVLMTGESNEQRQEREFVSFDASDSFEDEEDIFGSEDDQVAAAQEAARDSISRTMNNDDGTLLDDLNPDEDPYLTDASDEGSDDDFTFEFASSTDSVEVIADSDSAGSSRAIPSIAPAPTRSTSTSSSNQSSRDEPTRSTASSRNEPASSRSASSRSASSRSASPRDLDELEREDRTRRSDVGAAKALIAARVGASRFQSLNFVTYGFEVAVMPVDRFALVGGVDPHSTRQLAQDGTTSWATIVPINLGMQYIFGPDRIRPYVGADFLFIPGYISVPEGTELDGGTTAIGYRARGGIHFIVTDAFALNINVAAGVWQGQDFDVVQSDLNDTGLAPQLSGGTVLRF